MGELKETRKHISKLGLMFLLGAIIINLIQYGTMLLAEQLKPEWLENPNISLTLNMIPMYLIGMPLLILLVKKTLPAVTVERHSMKIWQFLLAVVMCFCVMYLSNFVGVFITLLIGFLKGSPVNNVVLTVVSDTHPLINILYMVICAPIIEEFIFRKLIVDRTVRYGQGVAILMSGLMFGLFHGNLNQFVYAFAIGAFFAFLYVKTGKIRYTIGIHMIVNFFGSIVSVWLMEAMNYEGYMEAVNSGDMEAMMNVMMASLPGWIAYIIYFLAVMAMMIAGIVLFIVFRKKFTLVPGEMPIPKGKRFAVVFLNVGMILYSVFWIVSIIWQLFQ